jgi:hypothetical protein
MVTLIKWSSLQKRTSKCMPKKFYDIDPESFGQFMLGLTFWRLIISPSIEV